MNAPLTLGQIQSWINARLVNGNRNYCINRATISSQQTESHDLFFALPGEKTDGHHFIRDVQQKHACAVIEEAQCRAILHSASLPLLIVRNVKRALHLLARKVWQQRKIPIIAITGSMGKTTTKNYLHHLLSAYYRVNVSPGNYNTALSLPLTLINGDPFAEWIILEMGMRHKGDIDELLSIAPPAIALITHISHAHANHFSSLDSLARAKAEILASPNTEWGILPADVPSFPLLNATGPCKKISFSISCKADYQLISCQKRAFSPDYSLQIQLPSLYPFVCSASIPHPNYSRNFISAAIAAHLTGIPWNHIARTSRTLPRTPSRLEFLKKGGITFIDDSYNHATLEGAVTALEVLASQPAARKVAILSEMREQGKWTKANHIALGKKAIECADVLLCLGQATSYFSDVWQRENKPYWHAEDKQQLLCCAQKQLRKGDVVLIKAARCYHLRDIIDHWP